MSKPPSRLNTVANIQNPHSANGSAAVRGAILKVLTDNNVKGTDKPTRAAAVIVNHLVNRGRLYYHEEFRDFRSSMFFDSADKVLRKIGSDEFIAWLSDWTGINRANGLFNYVQKAVQDATLCSPYTTGILPEAYWASREGAIYLSSGPGSIVRIKAGAVEMVDNGTDGVLFASASTLQPWKLTTPVDPFTHCALFHGTSFSTPHGQALIRAWALSLPSNPDCKPPLVLTGPVRSGKTVEARGIQALFGLPECVLKLENKGEDDFWPKMEDGGMVILDNADSDVRWLPDALAAAATGGGTERRRLYTNGEIVRFRPRAWVVVTSANAQFAADAGLADRLIVARMQGRRQTLDENKLLKEVRKSRATGMSFVAQVLSQALADQQPVPAGLNLRHPGFAEFAVRLGRAVQLEAAVMDALRAAESDKSRFCLENSQVGTALLAAIQAGDAGAFFGDARQLLERLKAVDPCLKSATGKDLSPAVLGKELAGIWSHVTSVFTADKWKNRRTGVWQLEIRVRGEQLNVGSAGDAGGKELFSEKVA